MSKVYFISDTHFLHDAIVEYCERPDNHNKIMIERWNSVVNPEDYVFHLGDFSAGVGKHNNGYEKLKKIASLLNGEKHLIRGNHDHYTDEQYKNDFGFASVQDYVVYKEYFLCHYPLIIDKYTKERHIENFQKMKEIFKQSGSKYLVHGHSHRKRFGGKRINVAVEQLEYSPILEENLLTII